MITTASCSGLPSPGTCPLARTPAVDQRDLGAHRETHGRDEAQHEDRAVAGRLEKLLHSYPASAIGTAVIFGASDADRNSPGTGGGPYLEVPPDVTAGRVVVVVGGLVVVVGGLVVVVGGAAAELVRGTVVVVVGMVVDVVDVVDVVLGESAGTVLVVGGAVGGAVPPGCSLATVIPMRAGGTTGEHYRRSGQAGDPCLCPGAGARCVMVPCPSHREPGRGRTWARTQSSRSSTAGSAYGSVPDETSTSRWNLEGRLRLQADPDAARHRVAVAGLRTAPLAPASGSALRGAVRQPMPYREAGWPTTRGTRVLFIEYDVDGEGVIELVALIGTTVEETGEDPDGAAWMAWRQPPLHGRPGPGLRRRDGRRAKRELERTEDPAPRLAAVVERIILADH